MAANYPLPAAPAAPAATRPPASRTGGTRAPSRSTKPPKLSVADIARLGPIAAQVRQSTSPAKWVKLVNIAHQRGFTINSFLDSNTPGPLKERTTESLRAQAQKTMADSYAPAFQALSDRERQTRNVDQLRAQDNQHYLDWLTAKSGEMQTHADVANQALLDASKQTQDAANTNANGLQGTAQAGLAASPGLVSNPTQSAAIGNLNADAARSKDMVANARQNTINAAGNVASVSAMANANNFALIAASEARRQADTWGALQGLGDKKTDLTLQRAGDSAKEVARLLDKETTKAQSNRDYGALATKLGLQGQANDIKAQGVANTNTNARSHNQILRDALKEKTTNDAATQDIATKAQGISQQKADAATKNANTAWYKAKHPNTAKGKTAQGTKSADPQTRFDAAYAALTSATRVKTQAGKAIRFDAPYVRAHKALVISQVQSATKVSRAMATLVVNAFITNNGATADPGPYNAYGAQPGAKVSPGDFTGPTP